MYLSRTCRKSQPAMCEADDGRNGFPVREKPPHLEKAMLAGRRKSLPNVVSRNPFLDKIIQQCEDVNTAFVLPATETLKRGQDVRRGGISVDNSPAHVRLDGKSANTPLDSIAFNAALNASLRRLTSNASPPRTSARVSPADEAGSCSPLHARIGRASRDDSPTKTVGGVVQCKAPVDGSSRHISIHGRPWTGTGDISPLKNSPKTSRVSCPGLKFKNRYSRRSSEQASPCTIDEHAHFALACTHNGELNQQDRTADTLTNITDQAGLRSRGSSSKVRNTDSAARSQKYGGIRQSLGWEPIVRPSTLVSRSTIESLVSNTCQVNAADKDIQDCDLTVLGTREFDIRETEVDPRQSAKTAGHSWKLSDRSCRNDSYIDRTAKRRLSRQLSLGNIGTKCLKQFDIDIQSKVLGPIRKSQDIQSGSKHRECQTVDPTRNTDNELEEQITGDVRTDDTFSRPSPFVPKQCWCLRCQIMLSMYNVGDPRLDDWGNYPCFRTNLSWKQSCQTGPSAPQQPEKVIGDESPTEP